MPPPPLHPDTAETVIQESPPSSLRMMRQPSPSGHTPIRAPSSPSHIELAFNPELVMRLERTSSLVGGMSAASAGYSSRSYSAPSLRTQFDPGLRKVSR